MLNGRMAGCSVYVCTQFDRERKNAVEWGVEVETKLN